MKPLLLVFVLLALMSACQSAPTRKIDSTAPTNVAAMSEVTPEDALPATSAAYSQFIDVRKPEEYAAGHADRARNIPLDQLAANLDVIEKNEPVYLICRTDNRSTQAAKILVDAGFKQAIVIKGGTEAWEAGTSNGRWEAVTYDILWVIGLFGFWLLLQLVILPKLGYPT